MYDAALLGLGTTEHEIAIENLPVQGQIPTWLSGTLIRNGPGAFQIGQQHYRHWFDGLAMLHRFVFQGGQVSYANKFIQGKAYQSACEANQITYSEFATDPCRSLFSRVMAVFSPQITDSAKVNIGKLAERYIALCETPIQIEFDPQTLETVGVFNYEQGNVGQMTTAHPHFDEDSVYNVVTRFNRVSQYRVYEMRAGGHPHQIAAVPVQMPAYMHSFGMSQNYIIITEFPLVVHSLSLLLWLKPFIENYQWKPRRGTPFYVIHRHTGELVGRYESDAFFAFHHVNAFEVGDELVVDIDAYEDASIIQSYYLNRLQDAANELPFGNLRRYRIPLKQKKGYLTYEVLSDTCIELPRIDYARVNMVKDYRYVYGIGLRHRQGFYNQLVKIDLKTGSTLTWSETDCYPGEGVFVAAPAPKTEDDGVILSVVLDAVKRTSFLLVLDAPSLTEIGRAEIPQPVLFGYHGEFFNTPASVTP